MSLAPPPFAPPPPPPPRPGLSLLKRFAIGASAIVLLAGGATVTGALLQVKSIVDVIKSGHKIPGIESALDSVSAGSPQTILILGSDGRWTERGQPVRSDTIMLIRLDPNNNATAIMSLPRDLKVTIPGYSLNGPAKINAAYADGGPKLTVKTIKALFGGSFPINHVVNIDFTGFARAINRLGCVYVDVDRRYFHSNVGIPVASGQRWSAINVQAGYQRLCGMDSLAFVRFRHADNDEVRAARQQWFIRQAKDQIPFSELFTTREDLLKIFSRYSQTDVRSSGAIFKLAKLMVESAGHPVRTVHLNEVEAGDYVTISQGDLAAAKESFLKAQSSGSAQTAPTGAKTTPSHTATTPHHKKSSSKKKKTSTLHKGLIDVSSAMENHVADAATRTGFPLYYPQDIFDEGGFESGQPTRVYTIADRQHHTHNAYRIVLAAGNIGQYYGIQGTTWQSPPLLDHPSEKRTVNGHHLELFYDSSKLRIVSWRTKRAVYWVSNTLSEQLSNGQMLGIAESLHRIG